MDRRAFIQALTIITGSATLALAAGLPVGPVLNAVDEAIVDTMSYWDNILKQYYTEEMVSNLTYSVRPMFASMPVWEKAKWS